MLQLYVEYTYMVLSKVHLKMTLNGITMGLTAEVLLLVTTVAIAGTVQSQVRGDNSYSVCVCVCEISRVSKSLVQSQVQ